MQPVIVSCRSGAEPTSSISHELRLHAAGSRAHQCSSTLAPLCMMKFLRCGQRHRPPELSPVHGLGRWSESRQASGLLLGRQNRPARRIFLVGYTTVLDQVRLGSLVGPLSPRSAFPAAWSPSLSRPGPVRFGSLARPCRQTLISARFTIIARDYGSLDFSAEARPVRGTSRRRRWPAAEPASSGSRNLPHRGLKQMIERACAIAPSDM